MTSPTAHSPLSSPSARSDPPEDGAAEPKKGSGLRRVGVIAAPALVIAAGVAAFAVIASTGPKPDETPAPPAPLSVQVATAEERTTAISISVQGEVRPRTQATLAAQVSGRIVWTSPAFADGAAFRAGETLVRLDDADARLAVVRAQARVAQAQESLAREEAESELARQDWETLGRGEPNALVLRGPQLAQARASLAAAEAELQAAELGLSRTAITAPFDGRMLRRRAALGDYVGPASPVAEIFATDVAEVRVPLSDADLAALQTPIGYTAAAPEEGRAAHLQAAVGGEARRWEGRLVRIEAALEAQTRLVYGVIAVRDPFAARHDSPLAPGLFVSVEIDSPTQRRLVAAPRAALKRNTLVYVVTPDDTISIRQVRPANTSQTHVYFEDGLAASERVVVSVLPSPREGMSVTPLPAQAAQPASQPSAPQ